MIIESINQLYQRDLRKLKKEIELYESDEKLWKTENSISNSGGNLCLHLIGNLKTYIGNGLANLDYIRQRDLEFSEKFIEREKLLLQIDETMDIVNIGFSMLSESDFEINFPIKIWDEETGMIYTIVHLHSHLNYHLGQINYHRRILDTKEIIH